MAFSNRLESQISLDKSHPNAGGAIENHKLQFSIQQPSLALITFDMSTYKPETFPTTIWRLVEWNFVKTNNLVVILVRLLSEPDRGFCQADLDPNEGDLSFE